jgi:hypothetical protein
MADFRGRTLRWGYTVSKRGSASNATTATGIELSSFPLLRFLISVCVVAVSDFANQAGAQERVH